MKIIKFFLIIYILFIQSIVLADNNFNEWVLDFKKKSTKRRHIIQELLIA